MKETLIKGDCLEVMPWIPDGSVDMVLTDIPYDAVNRKDNGLRNLHKGDADVLTFDIDIFLDHVYRISKSSICIFCGKEQFSYIFQYFASKKGTTRAIIWEKSNPSPMNGQHIYLSGVELAVWFKKSGAKTFNAHCKNTVFKFPNGKSKLHPTEKNINLMQELALDNTNEGDIICDPCMGSGSTGVACVNTNRNFIGIELNDDYFAIAKERIQKAKEETVNENPVD